MCVKRQVCAKMREIKIFCELPQDVDNILRTLLVMNNTGFVSFYSMFDFVFYSMFDFIFYSIFHFFNQFNLQRLSLHVLVLPFMEIFVSSPR
jgi:hypothetical protein